jgi:phosphoglycerate-specific signal transduction histidine kinase
MLLALRNGIQNGYINLLVSDDIIGMQLSSMIKGYNKLSDDMQTRIKLPYIQTTFLINEMINLEHEMSNNLIKVHEKTGMRKDRYSSFEYGYWVIQELSKNLKPKKETKEKLSDKFRMRKPELRRYGIM